MEELLKYPEKDLMEPYCVFCGPMTYKSAELLENYDGKAFVVYELYECKNHPYFTWFKNRFYGDFSNLVLPIGRVWRNL